jgi:phage-related protein
MVLTIGTGLIEQLPSIVEAGLQVIVSLAQGIADALPELVPTIVDVVLKIVDILTQPDTLSALVEASIAIIVALAEGLINAMPTLLEKAPVIIANLVTAIIALAPQLLQAALQLMATFAQGIVQGISSVISAIGELGSQIFSGIGDIVSKAWNWGKDLIENFTNGLKAFISKPIDAIKGLASKIRGFLGFSEPEEGPLSNFHTYAPDMMELFAQGITDNRGLITDAISKTFDISNPIATAAGAGETFTVPRANPAPRMMTVILQLRDSEVGRAIVPIVEAEQQRYGVKLVPQGVFN